MAVRDIQILGCLLVLAVLSALAQAALPEIPSDPAQAVIWQNRRLTAIDQLGTDAKYESLMEIGRMITQLENLGYRDCPQKHAVLDAAKRTLLSIPGYERLLTDPVRAEWERVNAAATPLERSGLVYQKLYPALGAFSALSHLPAPASVRALGDFLFDDRGRFTPEPGQPLGYEEMRGLMEAHPVLCDYAGATLSMLPIVDKPAPAGQRFQPETLPAWRRWYREIAEGRSTFRFEGDPVEYDLDGPASAEKLERIKALRERERNREERGKRNERGTARTAAPSPASGPADGNSAVPGSSYAAVSTAGGLVLAALAWYFLRRGKAGVSTRRTGAAP